MKYVVLLRGINVGGNRRVPMAQFRQLLEGMGFTDVKTYINSGNAIFSADHRPKASDIQDRLCQTFGFDVDTLVFSAPEIIAIAEAIPAAWQNDYHERKSDVLYLFDDVNTPDIVRQIAFKPDIEMYSYVDRAVICTILRKDQTRSSILKLIGTDLYKRMTIRNVTTARKLAELVR